MDQNMDTIQDNEDPQPASQETASLVRRLAGPSVTKAGLAKDQTEINRIIAEASKGSKFYENEKKKDKELSKRIESILKLRDETLKGVDLEKVEKAVDLLLADIEAHRDLTQIIVHVDMDAFFASVELLDTPSLAGKAFAVVGKGVLTTASYEARKFGVRSGMAGFIAKKLCPELIFMPIRPSRYSEMSNKVMSVLRRFDPNMCPAGCDECYLNITAYCEEHLMTAAECVQKLRDEVFEETKLTASAGIAPNKMLAKICSDKNKPNGQFQLEFDSASIIAFMRDLSIRKVPGIGRVNERMLEAIGIKTCGDIYAQRAVISLMDKQFGLMYLLQTHLGIASNVVQLHLREERKSIGAERTFSDLSDPEKIFAKLQEVAEELEQDMKETGWKGRTVTLKYKLDTYQVFTRAKSGSRWVSTKEELFAIGKELLMPEMPVTLRLIGLRVTKLKDLRNPATTGIKRFFESSGSKTESPRKRAKLEDGSEDVIILEDYMPQSDEDAEEHSFEAIHDDPMEGSSCLRNTPPVKELETLQKTSAKSSTTPTKRKTSTSSIQSEEQSATTPATASSSRTVIEEQSCPLCGKTLQTDNEGLNAHIDFCLSKGAIMEAQAESNKLPTSKKPFSWFKPPTTNKAKPFSKGKPPASKTKPPSKSKS